MQSLTCRGNTSLLLPAFCTATYKELLAGPEQAQDQYLI